MCPLVRCCSMPNSMPHMELGTIIPNQSVTLIVIQFHLLLGKWNTQQVEMRGNYQDSAYKRMILQVVTALVSLFSFGWDLSHFFHFVSAVTDHWCCSAGASDPRWNINMSGGEKICRVSQHSVQRHGDMEGAVPLMYMFPLKLSETGSMRVAWGPDVHI